MRMQQFEKFAQRMAVEIPELVDQFKHETKEKVEDIITAVQDQVLGSLSIFAAYCFLEKRKQI